MLYSIWSGTPRERLTLVLHAQCATQICLIRANIGQDGLIRADLGRAPHPGKFVQPLHYYLLGEKNQKNYAGCVHHVSKCYCSIGMMLQLYKINAGLQQWLR